MTTPEERLRRRVARRIGREDVPDNVWEHLGPHVADALSPLAEDEEEEVKYLAEEAGRAIRLLEGGRRKHPGRSRPRPAERHLTPIEREYVQTLSACLASHLGTESAVREFRDRYLGGRLLAEVEADQFKTGSPHCAQLYAVADRVRRRYPLAIWANPDGAETFILTGKVQLSPLRIESELMTGPLAPITLRIMPFISTRTVERAYRDFQRRLRGGDNRPVQQRGLALLRFVTERRAVEGPQKENWERWRKEWNREQYARPGRRFSERSAFRRAFLRAERAFLPRDVLSTFLSSTKIRSKGNV